MNYLFGDLETYSATPIKAGAHKYAEDSEILLFGYAIDDAPAKVWDLTTGEPMPDDLKQALEDVKACRAKTVWHNGMMFDRVVLKAHGIELPISQVIDTMVLAYQHGLTGALGDLCAIYKLPVDKAKDADGRRLVHQFCKPLAANRKLDRATRETHPADWEKFVNYCRLDVEAEREIFSMLPRINCTMLEHRIQVLDAEINDRGMLMDLDLARAAVALDTDHKAELARQTAEQTGGALMSANQRDELLNFLRSKFGVEIDSLTRSEIERHLENPDVPEPVKDLLRLRQATAKNSIQKFKVVLEGISCDNRMKGCLQFRGAMRTGRMSGRRFQPQNLARPTMSADEIELAIRWLKAGKFFDIYDDPSEVLPNLLRGLIIAPPGKKLVVADYSNVEGRTLAWLAGEQWKLQAFRDFDAGKGHDLYKLAYARAFGVKPEDVTKPQRQIGKVLELALGYGGGPSAFASFAKLYGIDLHDMAKSVRREIDPVIWDKAEQSWDFFVQKKLTGGLEKEVFLACDAVKRAWRQANPAIVGFWKQMDDALEGAMTTPNVVPAGRYIKLQRSGSFLLVTLPSGRHLCYPCPKLGTADSDEDRFSYLGVMQVSRKWARIRSYSAKVVENVTQAVACDLLCEAMLRLDKAGYKTVLSVHDEVIAEAPDTAEYSLADMAQIMTELPRWAEGLPLAAAGFESYRYRKD